MKNNITLGILGGLGPMSTVYFYEMLTSHTQASCDSDHIDTVISSRASTPDRTAYILGKSDKSPLPQMLADAKRLVAYGADLIAIPCNTAHCFYNALSDALTVPVSDIIGETVLHMKSLGVCRIGVLATEGTVISDAYGTASKKLGIDCIYPDNADQALVSDMIYRQIKGGADVDINIFGSICERLFSAGCERIVLGCTELSLIKKAHRIDERITDSLEVLAFGSIIKCGKVPCGFGKEFEYRAESIKI